MTTAAENKILTETGPGTPMGNLMRQYWLPVTYSWELEADGAPLKVRLLGEDLIAFRATDGTLGLMAEACPHRGASMFFGRNEENGLRCVYHGWKFDTEGQCVDMPNEPAESNFKHKIKAAAYAAADWGGITWVYMGPRQVTPPGLPEFEWCKLPEEQVHHAYKGIYHCNWMQTLEGDIDTSHFGFLHAGAVKPEEANEFLVKENLIVEGGKMPMQAYAKFLGGHGLPVTAVVTEMRFDTSSATPKLTFKAVRPLEEDELLTCQTKAQTPEAKAAIDATPAMLDGAKPKATAKRRAKAPAKRATSTPMPVNTELTKTIIRIQSWMLTPMAALPAWPTKWPTIAWSTTPCMPPMMFWSIVGHASFQTAFWSGPSTILRSKVFKWDRR